MKKFTISFLMIFVIYCPIVAQESKVMTTTERLQKYQRQFQEISKSQNSTNPDDFAKAENNFLTARINFAQIANQIAIIQQNIHETNAQMQEIHNKIQELKPKIAAIWATKINSLSIILLSSQNSKARIIDAHNKSQSVERMLASKYMLGYLQKDTQEIAQNFQNYNRLNQELIKKNQENQENIKIFNQHHAQWQELLNKLDDSKKIAQNYYDQLQTTQKLPPIKGDNIESLMAYNLAKLTDNKLNATQNGFIRQFNKKISPPFLGKIATGFGAVDNWGNINKGLTFGGDGQVFAPFDGKISFAREFKQQKIVVIIEHSDGYYSLLSGLDDVFVIENQTILEGEPIGLILPQKTDKSYLYFQLNRQGEALNPIPYLSHKS